MLAIEQPHPIWDTFYWDCQDTGWVDPQEAPWSFPEMLVRAIELEDAEPKQYLVGKDGTIYPDTEELDELRFCIDARLRAASETVRLRWPTNSARPRGLAGPRVVDTTGPRWAHLERKRVRDILEQD